MAPSLMLGSNLAAELTNQVQYMIICGIGKSEDDGDAE
jgi:hypothetical protein